MARKGSVPSDFATAVREFVKTMPRSSKLAALSRLIEGLRHTNPNGWRAVIFTTRRETQTTIQTYLEDIGLKVGVINGDTAAKNHDTIRQFKADPPLHRVIVSTEAGSEGVNLQIANVLVNYDLPWNPMIVEQRIGRIQRLNSQFAHVNIFNMVLTGTFEEYIVGRLMEKLQMAAHAIGDIEALLQGADVDDSDGEGSFEEKVLQLVLSSLAGQDVSAATRMQEQSIERAKEELARQETAINDMLGSMDGAEYVGPRAPKLPPAHHSLEAPSFVRKAFELVGANITELQRSRILVEENGAREYVRFQPETVEGERSTYYSPATPAFRRLTSRVIASGLHSIDDVDSDIESTCKEKADEWVSKFGARPTEVSLVSGYRVFNGSALLRVRATVAHDSYERLVDAPCKDHRGPHPSKAGLLSLNSLIREASDVGLDLVQLAQYAENDPAISEFVRFYLERRELECAAANTDERRRKKLFDEFTPRLEISLVGLTGKVHREVLVKVGFCWAEEKSYVCELGVVPTNSQIIKAPPLEREMATGKFVPIECLETCAISGGRFLRHSLQRSQESGRLARPDLMQFCEITQKCVLPEELERSAVTRRRVLKSTLRQSDVSGKLAEPEFIEHCEFTGVRCLQDELAVSQISGKKFRYDFGDVSELSQKRGYRDEFVSCHETRQRIALVEAERCEETQKLVRPGILEKCEISGKQVLPSQLKRSHISGRRALAKFCVQSSLSGATILKEEAIESFQGRYCLPAEARICTWTDRKLHPDDVQVCAIAGLPFQSALMTRDSPPRFQLLVDLLDGKNRAADASSSWAKSAKTFEQNLSGKCQIDAAALSPSGKHMVASCEVRTMLGFRVSYAGGLLDMDSGNLIGRLASGRRSNGRWVSKST